MSERIPKSGGVCVVLIGLRGSGKSIVGRELARLLGGECIDTDELIERRCGKPIAELFAERGEGDFRILEQEAVTSAADARPAVISVGGGAVISQRNVEQLRAAGRIVWLTAPPDVLWKRVCADAASPSSRPRLTRFSGREELEHLLIKRGPCYAAAADLVVDTTKGTPATIAAEILRRLA